MIEQVKGFEPIVYVDSTIITLGSMPSLQSLQAGQYYAHKQNAFWKILSQVFARPNLNTYEEKIALLSFSHIVLWDVLKTCQLKGSLDSSIAIETLEVNDFAWLFEKYPRI